MAPKLRSKRKKSRRDRITARAAAALKPRDFAVNFVAVVRRTV